MDISLLKNRMQALTKKPAGKKEKIDYKAVYWKPQEGKHQIRIVSSAYDKSNPFKEVFLHYGFSKFPIAALTNWGEADPIVDFVKQLRTSKDKEDWKLAGKLDPKMRVFIPVIVRGEEAMGVRLWEVGVKIYKQLISIAEDEDYGDYTDVANGRDFSITVEKGEVGNNKNANIVSAVQIKPKETPLSKNKEEVEIWLSKQPDILDILGRYKQTYDGLKKILQEWLAPQSDSGEDETTATIAEAEAEEEEDLSNGNDLPLVESIESTVVTKKKNTDKFEDLFKD